MCGIAGIWRRDAARVERGSLELMVNALIHRGPDGGGLYRAGNVALGHRRLKIIDLSDDAAQPIWLPDRSLCMVYNGEIHNFMEIAADLRLAGAALRADNDTEVLLWAYRLWGEDCFARLNGMWAAAFWEPAKQTLVLSRDRFGIKPLLYSVRGARIAFASEAKAITAAFPEERVPNRPHLQGFLGNVLSDPDAGEATFFANIVSVPAGHLVRIDATRETQARHWHFQPGKECSRPDAPEEFLALLGDAVKVRQRSDVPVGILLSGGLDSSTVARLATGDGGRPLQCVSLKYSSALLDESRFAQIAADDPSRYEIHWVTPSADHLLDTVNGIVWHHDAPTPLRGRYPQWHVFREASRHVTVVLGGQGADEILGGYDRFIWPFLLDRLNPRLPNRRSRWSLLRELYDLGQVTTGIHKLLPPFLLAALTRHLRRRLRGRGDGVAPLRTDHYHANPPITGPYQSRFNNALWSEFTTAGLPEMLHSEDALSMAFSLESRLPFLDHRLVEFCFSLAYDEKIGDGWTKVLLRRATPGILPEPIRLRRHKLGFPADYGGWMGRGAGLDAIRAVMLDPSTLERGWVDRQTLVNRFGGSRRRAEHWITHNPQTTWNALTVELWCRQFFDPSCSSRPAPSERVRLSAAADCVVDETAAA